MNRTLLALLIAAAPAVLFAQLPEYVPSDGLEFWSNFDGDAEDESLQSVSSSIHGAQPTANRNGEDNKALAFDGQDDYVLLFENEGGTSFGESLTLAAWVRPASSILNGTHSRIFNSTEGVGGGPDRWLFTWSPPEHEEKMQFQVDPSGSNGPYGSTPLTVGEWSHVAMVFDQGQVSFYHNGEADGSVATPSTSLAHVLAPIQIGSANGNSFFHGDIDEVGIWAEALSTAHIQALFSGSAPQPDPIEGVENGCELFSIQSLAQQNLSLLDSNTLLSDSINELHQILDECCSGWSQGTTDHQGWTCGDSTEYFGYEYPTVEILDRCWFAENLRTAQFSQGDSIMDAADHGWGGTTNLSTTIPRFFNGCGPSSFDACGYVYNYDVVRDERQICPSGWHVPELQEWQELQDIDPYSLLDPEMPSSWYNGYQNPYTISGFDAWGCGYIDDQDTGTDPPVRSCSTQAYWWTSTGTGLSVDYCCMAHANRMFLNITPVVGSTNPNLSSSNNSHVKHGFSIRCIKDQ